MQVVLEEALKEERQRGKEFAEEIKEETKKEMLEYSRVRQEVKIWGYDGKYLMNEGMNE